MANKILWAAESEAILLAAELNNLANAAFAVDTADYDNATNKFQMADFLLYCIDFDAAPTAGGYFELHIFYKLDGTNYADNNDGDADADSVPGGNTYLGVFPIQATDGPQYVQLVGVPLSPKAFRAALYNKTGTGLTSVDTNLLKMYPYNPEIQ
jgi:hypothetical protein